MLTAGARLGPYEIVGQLGAGGMGEVYRARDTRLGRDVAIKVLPAAFAADAERLRRFEQEARATAALSHPNILFVFDVGTHEGSPYLVEELLEGESLRERLRGGALPVPRAVEIAVAIANGLADAHDKAIVHRDLKPDNVFITEGGTVKILDFGLAKLADAREGTGLSRLATGTAPHTVLGTAGYMAPEQVRGQPCDPRTDIFALGCVLYEMLSGRRAFLGATQADTLSAVLKEEPVPLAQVVADLPPRLDAIVRRCLEKRPEGRFQSARDLVHDLSASLSGTDAVSPTAVSPSRSSLHSVVVAIAGLAALGATGAVVLHLTRAPARAGPTRPPKVVVLPFENLGPPEDAYFAAGMVEEITSRLANVHGLGVISRTSAVGYNAVGKTVKQVGSDLGVDYVLEGSVRWEHGLGSEARMRITPQLIRVADDIQVWSDRYDRVIADVFAIQSDVAESVVKAMGVALLPREQTALKEISTTNLEAYDLYLRGRELSSRGQDRKHVEAALRMYQAAVDRDPRFAQAFAGLAGAHLGMFWMYYDHSRERLLKAKAAAERAVELRPDLPETHDALGWYFYQGLLDYPRALDEFAAARGLQPNDSDAFFGAGAVLRRQGRWGEAAEAMSRALELDPKNPGIFDDFALTCVLDRRYADADRASGVAIALSPQWAEPYEIRALLQVQWHGDVEKARAVLNEARQVAGLSDDPRYLGGGALSVILARRDYGATLQQFEASPPKDLTNQFEYSPISLIRGEVQSLAGQHDLARRSFEAARDDLEQKASQTPDDARVHGSLGIVYARLGRGEAAVREARLARDLMPASKDAFKALYCLGDMALVYAIVGQPTEAITTLDDLLARSGWFTPHVLRLDPRWDPLRTDPRFQALLTRYEVKE